MAGLITRRSFVRTLGVGAAGLLAVACGTRTPPAAPTAAPGGATSAPAPAQSTLAAAPAPRPVATQAAPAAAPKPAVSRLVMGFPPPSIEGSNPSRDLVPDDVFQLRPTYEALIGNDPRTGAFVPMLAESWSVEPDGKSVRFKLRKGVQFHDGFGEFTARDVLYTYQDLMEPDSTSSNQGALKEILDGIEVVNDHEIVARAKIPDYGIFFAFSTSTGGMEIRSKADADSRNGVTKGTDTKPVAGTGPYQFAERKNGQYIRFARVPYQHWRVTPDFPELEYRWQPDNSTRLAALLSGETHLASLTFDALQQAEGRGMRLFKGEQVGVPVAVRYLGYYLKDPKDASKGYQYPESPIMDVRVRKALSKAVDRGSLNRIFLNQGEPMYLRSRHQSLDGWSTDWESQFAAEYDYDPDAAKKLLAEAGYSASNPLKFYGIARQGNAVEATDVMDAITTMWRAVGVDASLQTLDPPSWRVKRTQLQFTQHGDYIVSSGYPQFLQFRFNSGLNAQRGGAFEDPRIDDNYRKVLAQMTDDAKRADLWRAVGNEDYALHSHIPLFWTRIAFAGNPKVIADYRFPGNLGSFITHHEQIKAAV